MSARKSDIGKAVLESALPDIGREGFTEAVLERAARKLGLKASELHSAFPNGAASLVEAFSQRADQRMSARMRNVKQKGTRARVTAAVKARIEALGEHKEATRRAMAFLALPPHAPLAAKLLYRSVDAMWRAAGDRSTDFSFYTKRATLAGVYGATLLYWLGDRSEDNEKTWAFLDNRMTDVMNIGKFKKNALEAMEKLPDPFGLVAAWSKSSGR